MAKILMFTVEDMAAPGIRCLGSYLKERTGHQPILVFIEFGARKQFANLEDVPQESWDNEINFAGFKQFAFSSGVDPQQRLPDDFIALCKKEKPDIIGFSTRFCERRCD